MLWSAAPHPSHTQDGGVQFATRGRAFAALMVRSPAQSNGCREVLTRYPQAAVARQAMLHGKAETKGLLGFSRDLKTSSIWPAFGSIRLSEHPFKCQNHVTYLAASPRSWSR